MDKEKATRDLSVKVQPSLFEKFAQKCKDNYRSVSDVVRELMAFYAVADSSMIQLMLLHIATKQSEEEFYREPTEEDMADWTPEQKEWAKQLLHRETPGDK